MEMVGHQNEFMKQVFAAVAIMLQSLNYSLRDFCHAEQSAVLRCLRCDEVGGFKRGSMCQSSHLQLASGAKAR